MNWFGKLLMWLGRGQASLVSANDAWHDLSDSLTKRIAALEVRLDTTEKRLVACLAECEECHRARAQQQVEIDQLRSEMEKLK